MASEEVFFKKLLAAYESTCMAYANTKSSFDLFSQILEYFLSLTESEYGFIGRVLYQGRTPYLKTVAISDIAWNEETYQLYHDNVRSGLEFYNLNTLFGKVITTGNLLITNDPKNEPGSAGIPEGHPNLDKFMGIPLHIDGIMIGMIGLANRKAGYDKQLYQNIKNYCNLCAKLIDSYHHYSKLDVIAQKNQALTSTEEALEKILEGMADAVIIIGSDGLIEYCNRATAETFGYTHAEMLGNNVSFLMAQPYRKYHDSYMQAYVETGEKKVIGTIRELTALRKSGETFAIELSVSELDVHGKNKYIGVVRDISERKKIEEIKSELIAVASHELRTPITSIKGTLGLLASEKLGTLTDKGSSLVKVAKGNCDRLVRLLNDMLDMEKIKSGNLDLKLKKENLYDIIKQAVAQNEGFAEMYGVELKFDSQCKNADVLGDADKIIQVLTNLFSNAIKYSKRNEAVEVGLDDFGEQYVVHVRDHGEGISKEDQKTIFNAFTQVDSSSTREKGGTGLGLTITKKIVEMHHGEVGLDSEPGQGTTFHFSIPKFIRIVENENKKHHHDTILIHEADQEILLILRYVLERHGLSTRYVINSQFLKNELNHCSYSALLIDCDDIYESVEELISEIRQASDMKSLPIILLVETVRSEHQQLVDNDNAVIGVIAKPVDEDKLFTLLKEVKLQGENDG